MTSAPSWSRCSNAIWRPGGAGLRPRPRRPPPQVADAGETYFSVVVAPTPATPARRYRGILATGERLKSVEIRVASAVLERAQYLFDRYGAAADPYMTAVDYFTSTRELAGMRRLVDDDVAGRLASQQVRTRRRRPTVSELTSRMPSSKISSTLAELERPFDAGVDTTAALEEFKRDRAAARERLDSRLRPLDVLLATSMLQVGLDCPLPRPRDHSDPGFATSMGPPGCQSWDHPARHAAGVPEARYPFASRFVVEVAGGLPGGVGDRGQGSAAGLAGWARGASDGRAGGGGP